MANEEKEKADFQHICSALGGALNTNRTFSDIWLITSKKGEGDEYKPALERLTLITASLPKMSEGEPDRTSLLINYLVGEGEDTRSRTFGHIMDETNDGLDKTCEWITEIAERAMSDLFNTTYNVHFAITEHTDDAHGIAHFTNRVAMTMLGQPTSYEIQYNLPAYIAGILRVKGERTYVDFKEYVKQVALMESILFSINRIK